MDTNLKTNPVYDEKFREVESILANSTVPKDFEFIYDVSRRLMNKHGLGINFIQYIYTLGLINGKKEARRTQKSLFENVKYSNIIYILSALSIKRRKALFSFAKGLLKSEINETKGDEIKEES